MYALSKVHKPLINNFPKLRSILSAINTTIYGWAKYFVLSLECFTMNEYTLKDSVEFAKNIINQNSNCFMASLDVESLFTDVPFDETIKICIDQLFKSKMTESIILFGDKYYSQIDGVAMRSPLGPTLANIFLWLILTSFIPFEYKYGFVHTLLNRCFNLS